MSCKFVDKVLEDVKVLGICNILVLRGDFFWKDEYWDYSEVEGDDIEDFIWVVDLVKYIRKNYGDYFCIGVVVYFEGYVEESYFFG